jgi:hypothetical protein
MPPPDFDPDEATFRWRMYRTFGEMMEIGVMEVSPAARDEFQQLARTLEEFQRPDTAAFISDVKVSADRWLTESAGRRPWIPAFDFSVLGPNGLDEVRQIWGRDATLWGADLAEEDRRAIEEDLSRRRAAAHASGEAADSAAEARA